MTDSSEMIENAVSKILAAAKENPAGVALDLPEQEVSYAALSDALTAIAGQIESAPYSDFVCVLGYRSLGSFAGSLGALAAGRAFVPLNPKFPVQRTLRMIERSEATLLLVSEESQAYFESMQEKLQGVSVIELGPLLGQKCVESAKVSVAQVEAPSPCYMLFTSGTTGDPKGIAVSHGNLNSYVDYTLDRYRPSAADRFSQTFDPTFDLSIHDIFVSLSCGARLCVLPEASLMAPAKYIKEKEITFWFSVPAVAMIMQKLRMLKDGNFPSIKWSLFCGEALPLAVAQQWQKAAPNSVLENLYGPTEATIAFTSYRFDPSNPESTNSLVPIGKAFEGLATCIVDDKLMEVDSGNTGELCLGGAQVAGGYWKDAERSKEKFVELPGQRGTWYRTGDLARELPDGNLVFLGRIDNQIKIAGHRIELLEIDAVLGKALGTNMVASVTKPSEGTAPTAIFAAVEAAEPINKEEVLASCREFLPDYMVPSDIYQFEKLPLNSNGKIDRNKIAQDIEERLKQ
jgi:amino acid adenylation domain-containing protein